MGLSLVVASFLASFFFTNRALSMEKYGTSLHSDDRGYRTPDMLPVIIVHELGGEPGSDYLESLSELATCCMLRNTFSSHLKG